MCARGIRLGMLQKHQQMKTIRWHPRVACALALLVGQISNCNVSATTVTRLNPPWARAHQVRGKRRLFSAGTESVYGNGTNDTSPVPIVSTPAPFMWSSNASVSSTSALSTSALSTSSPSSSTLGVTSTSPRPTTASYTSTALSTTPSPTTTSSTTTALLTTTLSPTTSTATRSPTTSTTTPSPTTSTTTPLPTSPTTSTALATSPLPTPQTTTPAPANTTAPATPPAAPAASLRLTFQVAYRQHDFVELLPAFKKALQLTIGQQYTAIRVWIDDSARRAAATGTTRVVSTVSGSDDDIALLATRIQADSSSFLRAMNEELSRQNLTEATLLSVTDAKGATITAALSTPAPGEDYTSTFKTHVIIVICFGTTIGASLVGIVLYASRRRFWVFRDSGPRDQVEERETVIRNLAEDTELSPALVHTEVDLERAVSPDTDGLVNRRPRRAPAGDPAV